METKKAFKNINLKINGQILVESMVAIMVVTMGLFGILTLLTKSLAINREMSEKFIATYLAAEGIEIVKNLVDVNYTSSGYCLGTRAWNDGLLDGSYNFDYYTTFDTSKGKPQWLGKERINPPNSTSTEPLLFHKASRAYRSGVVGTTVIETPFTRTVRIKNIQNSDNEDYEIVVTSIIEWTTKGKKQEVKFENHFFEWRGSGICPSP
ncbi:MAG: hypothetical protein QMD65_03355 [Patescibacteria group bacterium]|nr:hypothetical protein [Patescibacteria group bacterium]